MDLAFVFFTSFMVGLSGAMMPGPMLTLTIAETPSRGARTGPLLVLGHGVIEAAVVVGLVIGLSQLVTQTRVTGTVALLGGGVLIWMGYDMARAAWTGAITLAMKTDGTRGGAGSVVAGALVSATNPYWLIWWATIGATYVVWALQLGTLGLVSFFGGHILSDLAWFGLVALLVASGRHLLNDRVYRGLILVCAVGLVALGVFSLLYGANSLRA